MPKSTLTEVVNVRLTPGQLAKVRAMALKQQRSVSNVLRILISNSLQVVK
jgi:hypothetical protein